MRYVRATKRQEEDWWSHASSCDGAAFGVTDRNADLGPPFGTKTNFEFKVRFRASRGTGPQGPRRQFEQPRLGARRRASTHVRHDDTANRHEFARFARSRRYEFDHSRVTITAVVEHDEVTQGREVQCGHDAGRQKRLESAASSTDWILDVQVFEHAQPFPKSIQKPGQIAILSVAWPNLTRGYQATTRKRHLSNSARRRAYGSAERREPASAVHGQPDGERRAAARLGFERKCPAMRVDHDAARQG
jgi:hypothetical protein